MKEKTETNKEYIDPICGMKVSPEKAAASLEHGGEIIYFCSKSCFETFKRKNNIEDAPAREDTENDLKLKAETHIDPICGMTVTRKPPPENLNRRTAKRCISARTAVWKNTRSRSKSRRRKPFQ